MESLLRKRLQKIGGLRDMYHAVNLIISMGYTVTYWHRNLVINIERHEDIELEERGGLLWVK